MIFFAIRRRSDGAFLPAVCGKRGSTQAETSTAAPPRLFLRAADARAALRFWAHGVWRLVRLVLDDAARGGKNHCTPMRVRAIAVDFGPHEVDDVLEASLGRVTA